jgi:hypothetical protein
VGLLSWEEGEEFAQGIAEALRGLSCEIRSLSARRSLDLQGLDVLLLYGPWGSLEPVRRSLASLAPEARPITVLWQSEQFPDPKLPTFLWHLLGWVRSYAETIAYERAAPPGVSPDPRLKFLASRFNRFRYFGDVCRYTRQGIVDVLAVWSDWTAELLRRKGLNPIVAHMGYYPECGRDLGLERDIPVVWLGKLATPRRARLVDQVRHDLELRGLPFLIIDGRHNPYIFGERRTVLLNRTKIMVNLLRQEWDDNSMRFFFASANGAMVISEPILPHTPLRAGTHYVEARAGDMAAAVDYYLRHESERQAIVERARALLVGEISMRRAMERILEGVRSVEQADPRRIRSASQSVPPALRPAAVQHP